MLDTNLIYVLIFILKMSFLYFLKYKPQSFVILQTCCKIHAILFIFLNMQKYLLIFFLILRHAPILF
jgi:hypothetical protein